MTYSSQETSQEAGRPVDIYEFELELQVYRYTSAEDDQVVDGNTYTAIPISRTKITQGQETRQAALTIKLPSNDPLASRYITTVPSEKARVTVRQFHRGDGSTVTIFRGLIKSVAFSGSDGREAQIAVDPPITVAARQIPRFTFRGQCNNVLGDGADGGPGLCDVDLEDPAFKLVSTVSAQSGLTITAPGAAAFGDGWFNGGTIETLSGLDARMILFQVGDVLTLHIGFPFPLVGEQVVLRAGCDHSVPTCSSKFNKVGVFQGFAFVPRINPFEAGLDPALC